MAQSKNLPLDADRLWADVMALAEITDPARPYTRRSFTALFLEGRVLAQHARSGAR
jgi:N-carbamoyl-L-amino-acid hydrolase